MGKLTPMTKRMSNLAMNVLVIAREQLAADGVICERDEAVLIGLKRLNAKAVRLDNYRKAARTMEDACEITDHVVRTVYEDGRDLTPILALSPNYPRTATETADIA